MKNLLSIVALAIVISSCDPHTQSDNAVLVEVNDQKLKKSEVMSTLPKDISTTDSALLVNNYTESWIKHRLLLQKAELNVGNNPEIRELVDKYKEQLLIENYLRLLVERKAEINPTEEQVAAFYEEHKDNYILPENLVKGVFVVIPLDASNKDILYSLLKADETDNTTIEAYCLQNAAKVDFFTEDWLAFRLIKKHLPELTKSEKRVLSDRHFYEDQDSLFQYILKIDDHKTQGETAPLSYVYEELEEFLLNSNKVSYLQKMEEDLYQDAIRKGIVKYND